MGAGDGIGICKAGEAQIEPRDARELDGVCDSAGGSEQKDTMLRSLLASLLMLLTLLPWPEARAFLLFFLTTSPWPRLASRCPSAPPEEPSCRGGVTSSLSACFKRSMSRETARLEGGDDGSA